MEDIDKVSLLINQMDNAAEDIRCAKTVLHEAYAYFDTNDMKEINALPIYSEQIRRLLYVVDNLLFDTAAELDEVWQSIADRNNNMGER